MSQDSIRIYIYQLLTNPDSCIRAPLASFQDGRHSPKMAAMAPIQAQIRVTTSDDPVTRSVSPRKVS